MNYFLIQWCIVAMKSFQISRLQLLEMMDELFFDTVVHRRHEELFTSPSINDGVVKNGLSRVTVLLREETSIT